MPQVVVVEQRQEMERGPSTGASNQFWGRDGTITSVRKLGKHSVPSTWSSTAPLQLFVRCQNHKITGQYRYYRPNNRSLKLSERVTVGSQGGLLSVFPL